MSEQHARSDRVLDATFVADLGDRSADELRGMHAECLELETEVSYVRRLTQARIDILEAELGRRERGDSLEDLI
ncbi:MAG: aerial mycelium formation protein, partial [Acidimicrobiia bacterium]